MQHESSNGSRHDCPSGKCTERCRKNREVRNACGVLGGNVADRAANLRITVGSNVLVESATEKHRKNREVRNSCGVL